MRDWAIPAQNLVFLKEAAYREDRQAHCADAKTCADANEQLSYLEWAAERGHRCSMKIYALTLWSCVGEAGGRPRFEQRADAVIRGDGAAPFARMNTLCSAGVRKACVHIEALGVLH
jgi:hypothetical protein